MCSENTDLIVMAEGNHMLYMSSLALFGIQKAFFLR